MRDRRRNRRAANVVAVICIVIITLLLMQVFGTLYSAGQPYVVFPLQVEQELSRAFEGPDPNALYLSLQVGQYEIVNASQEHLYHVAGDVIVQMEGFSQSDSPGDPTLPYQVCRVALPPEAVPNSLRIETIHISEKELLGNYQIAPAPPYLLIQEEIDGGLEEWGYGKKIVEGRNILIYENDAFYPDEYCTVGYGGQLRKWKIASVVHFPFRYNPVRSKLIVAEETVLKISFDRDPEYLERSETQQLLRDKVFDKRAKQLCLNYDQAKDWYQQPIYEELLETPEDPNYAIITTEDIFINSALDDFCFHKQDLGFTVIVVTEHQTRTVTGPPESRYFAVSSGGYRDVEGEPPNQRPQKIRKWLNDSYVSLGLEYVLLIGDPTPIRVETGNMDGAIPMQICIDPWQKAWGRSSNKYEAATDHYYSDLTGNWNLDEDQSIGEYFQVNNLPSGVTPDRYCVRWEGVVEALGDPLGTSGTLSGRTDGSTKIWLDVDQNGFSNEDIIFEDPIELEYTYYWECEAPTLEEGQLYPIRIEYKQSNGDAFCCVNSAIEFPGVRAPFKYDDGNGNYEWGLWATYFNNNDFSGIPVVEEGSRYIYDMFVTGDCGAGGIDFYSEVIVGRVPCYDEDLDSIPDYVNVTRVLNKIIEYENADIQENPWRRRVLVVAPDLDDYAWGGWGPGDTAYKLFENLMDNVASPPLWDWYRIYEENYPDVYPPAEWIDGIMHDAVMNAWNDPGDPEDGRGVVMWLTHGDPTGASGVIYSSDCASLDDSKPSIVVQGSCLNGKPEVHRNLGFSLLKKGAIATFSATRIMWASGDCVRQFNVDFEKKRLCQIVYFLAKAIFNNVKVGYALAHSREWEPILDWNYQFSAHNLLVYHLYGDPSLSLFGANPKSNNDVVFLLDGSGSMLYEGKWEAAVEGTCLFYDLMKKLGHPALKYRYATVVFRWDPDDYEDASTYFGLRDISIPLTAAELNAAAPPHAGYLTPIGEGLGLAIDQLILNSEESFYSNKVILLLSDGKHNAGIDPQDVVVPEEIQIYAVGLGEDYIEPETIRDIARESEAHYRITPSSRIVIDFFLQILCDSSWKLQDVHIPEYSEGDRLRDIPIWIDESTAVFIAVKDDPTEPFSFKLDPPGEGPYITPENLMAYYPMEVTYHPSTEATNHAFYVCKNIPVELFGDWHFYDIRNVIGYSVPLDEVLLKVIEDPRTIAEFDIENVDHYTGQPIKLTAKITENGKPKLGLTEVYADLIRSPALAIGTLMAENTPPPDYPPQPPDKADLTLRAHYLLGVMESLGLESLSKNGSRIYMRDDGFGYDSKANDGVYTGIFKETEYEGSYTFKFRAKGENRDGVTFERTTTLSEYVNFAASPTETEVEFVSTATKKDDKTVNMTIRVTPRDAFGSYLGPFRGDLIRVWSSSGDFEPSYKDHMDGSYSFTLVYPVDNVPLVSVSVGDAIVAEQANVEDGGIPPWAFLALILLIVLILLIFLYIIARQQN